MPPDSKWAVSYRDQLGNHLGGLQRLSYKAGYERTVF
jgi:hypothetical protein